MDNQKKVSKGDIIFVVLSLVGLLFLLGRFTYKESKDNELIREAPRPDVENDHRPGDNYEEFEGKG